MSIEEEHNIKKPNLFIVGAPKCGTTAVSRYLASHPDIYFSTPNELHFFNEGKGNWKTGKIETQEDYLSFFEGAGSYKIVGEGTPAYLSSQTAIKCILAFNPDAKFIVMVRNPLDMFVSLFWQKKLGAKGEKARTPEDAWRNNGEYKRICSVGYQLEQLYALVPSEQVLVLFFDDLTANSQRVYRKALTFLDLEPDSKELTPQKEREKKPSRPLKILNQNVAKVKKRAGIRFNTGFVRLLNEIEKPFREGRRATLRPGVKEEMIQYFCDDIKKLEQLENRDLSHWFK